MDDQQILEALKRLLSRETISGNNPLLDGSIAGNGPGLEQVMSVLQGPQNAGGSPSGRGAPASLTPSTYQWGNQPGTNLPGAVTTAEARAGRTPTWDGKTPPGVAPGAIPIYTGQAGPSGYGGNIEWLDPFTGKVYSEYGLIRDNQLANLGGQLDYLRNTAAQNTGGMLTRTDFNQALSRGYGNAVPVDTEAIRQRKMARGYGGGGAVGNPGYVAPTAPLSDFEAQRRYNVQQTRKKAVTDPRVLAYMQKKGMSLTPPANPNGTDVNG